MGFGKYVQPDESARRRFLREGCRGLDTDKEPLAAGVHFRVMVLFSQIWSQGSASDRAALLMQNCVAASALKG